MTNLKLSYLASVHSCYSLVTVHVTGYHISLANQTKILGVTLNKNLSIYNHVIACHQQIRSLPYPCFTPYSSLHI